MTKVFNARTLNLTLQAAAFLSVLFLLAALRIR